MDPPWPSSSRASPKPHEPPNLLNLAGSRGRLRWIPSSQWWCHGAPHSRHHLLFFFLSFSFLPSSRFFFLSWAVTTCCNSSFPLVRCCLLL
jgi:hypothetical protein